uniref:Uncharacterized protein LOC105037092 n=1 Tax=Elaeis guineensis var. tenera TaxID=51953 RepID=A0A6I9QMS4_ELAGV
ELDEQLDQKIEKALNNNGSSMLSYEGNNNQPPFVLRNMQEPLPLHFKLPQLEAYDGTSDSVDHVETFKAAMLLQGASDAILCRAFPPTLKEVARQWYLSLRLTSIHSFEDLCRFFVGHFISNRRQQKRSDYLHTIKQKEDESMAAMMSDLLKNDLKKSLVKTYPRDLPDMLVRVEKYVRMKEAFADDTTADSTVAGSSKEHHPRCEEKSHQRSRSLPQREVLLQMGPELFVPQLMRIRSECRRNPNKYCSYHHDHGHDIEDCHQLYDEIERFI